MVAHPIPNGFSNKFLHLLSIIGQMMELTPLTVAKHIMPKLDWVLVALLKWGVHTVKVAKVAKVVKVVPAVRVI